MRQVILLSLFTCYCCATCPSGFFYNATFDSCYKYVSVPAIFPAAEKACMSMGGHLVSIRNHSEDGMIMNTAKSYFVAENATFWLGARKGNEWGWTNGHEFSYVNWAVRQPTEGLLCGVGKPNDRQWEAKDCTSEKYPYFCATKQEKEKPMSTCPTCPPAREYCESTWTYFAPTSSCYKVFHHATGLQAQSDCRRLNANLSSINSDEENRFIYNMTTTLNYKSYAHEHDGFTLIGLHRVSNATHSTFVNYDGTPVNYVNWKKRELNNDEETENCALVFTEAVTIGGISVKGQWNDIACNIKMRSYVCKKSANR